MTVLSGFALRRPPALVQQSNGIDLTVLPRWALRYVAQDSSDSDNSLPDAIPLDIVPRPEAFQGRPHGDGKLFPTFPRTHENKCKDSDLEFMVKTLENELRWVRNAPWVKMDQLPLESVMKDVMDGVDDDMRDTKVERERKKLERNPAGRGELR